MSVLDALKSRLEDLAHEQRQGGGSTWHRAIGDALLAVDAFEEQHPGLVDFTKACKACGNLFVGYCEEGRDLCGLCGRSENDYDSGVYK